MQEDIVLVVIFHHLILCGNPCIYNLLYKRKCVQNFSVCLLRIMLATFVNDSHHDSRRQYHVLGIGGINTKFNKIYGQLGEISHHD